MAADSGKAFERRHAKRFLGGRRIHRGADFSQSLPDGESGSDVWDCKDRQGIKAVTWYREAEELYRKHTGERRFHLALHIPGQKRDYVLLDANDYAELVKVEGRAWFLGYMDADVEERTRL